MVAIASSIVSTHQWTRQDVVSPQRLKARGPVAQWIRHRPTEPGIAGSSPAGVIVLSGHAVEAMVNMMRMDHAEHSHATGCINELEQAGGRPPRVQGEEGEAGSPKTKRGRLG